MNRLTQKIIIYTNLKKGAILISVLLLFLILSALLFSIYNIFEIQLFENRNNYNYYKIYYAIDGAKEKILTSIDIGKKIEINTIIKEKIGSVELFCIINNEMTKKNINKIQQPELLEIIKKIVSDNQRANIITDSILDWIDADDLQRLNGAEKDYYVNNGFDYTPKNAAIDNIFELSKIRGFENSEHFIFRADSQNYLEKYITAENIEDTKSIISDSLVDINIAADTVLKTDLKLTEKQIAEIIEYRKNNKITVKSFIKIISAEQWNLIKNKIKIDSQLYSLKLWNKINKYDPQLFYYILFTEKESLNVKKNVFINLF